ncbi:MAG: sodium:proton antiporter [Verrucomicrobia bacterium]|nr:sodium:proton antiporter [Verrucomicrobiota bacterium]
METAHIVQPNPLWIAPFAALLLAIALMPFIAPKWWHHRYPWVAVALGALTTGYYVFGLHNGTRMLHSFHEYVSFIALIGSLFVVSGGIHINVRGESTPMVNVLYLLIGALLANVLGTTGASMLLIRPFLRTNKYRLTTFHVVFFIFIVSNVGGCLTPLGDPPLFLGYLRGVPFTWVAEKCWPMWAFVVGALLVIFWVMDYRNFLRAPRAVRAKETAREEWRFAGMHNVFFLLLILVAVFIQQPPFVRETLMFVAALGSYFTTKKPVHEANDFNFAPLKEVAFLFIGIFATMVPALDWLELNARQVGIQTAGQFYWGTGILSAVLDNAPTYLCFLSAAIGLFNDSGVTTPAHLVAANHLYLVAISVASVFFGACTYIGNGPNFMVKSIADHATAKTPSFFGYIFCYVVPILLPVYAVVWWIWFKG